MNHKRPRRCRLEVVESRMMLAASIASTPDVSSAPGQVAAAELVVSDGFIDLSTRVPRIEDTFSSGTTHPIRSQFDNGDFSSWNWGDADGSWSFNDLLNASSGGVAPLVTPPELNFGTSEFGPSDRDAANNTSDGGPISIPEILAQAPGLALEPGALASRTPGHFQVEGFQRAQTTSASLATEPALYGEWARAVVVETAGGEARSAAISDVPRSADRPFESLGHDATLPVSGELIAPQPSVRTEQPVAREPEPTHALPVSNNSDELQAESEEPAVERAFEARAQVPTLDAEFAVRDEAFDRLGDEEIPTSPWLVVDLARRGSTIAPLLVALAVERVTARRRESQVDPPSPV